MNVPVDDQIEALRDLYLRRQHLDRAIYCLEQLLEIRKRRDGRQKRLARSLRAKR